MKSIKGEWRWNEVISFPAEGLNESSGHVPGGFSSNGETYYYVYQMNDVHWQGDPRACDCLTYEGSITVCAASQYHDDGSFSWMDDDYRIISFGVFGVDISDELYDFINSNATLIETTVSYKLGVIADNQEKVYVAGKDAEWNAFWDIIQQSGNRTSYDVAFCWWDCEYLHPKYKVVPTYNGGARNMIYRCAKLKKIESAYFDLSQLPNPMATSGGLGYLFGLCDELEEIEDVGLQPCYSLGYFCYSDKKLKKIAVIRIAEETKVDNMLYYCPELEYVRIEGTIGQSGLNLMHSTKLSRESIESIVNHLSDTAEGKSLTFSKAAVDKAFETSEGANDGASSQEWDSLEGLKMNWEITLV